MERSRNRWWALLMVALVVLTGCGASGGDASAPATSASGGSTTTAPERTGATTTTVAGSSTTTVDRSSDGERYLELVKPPNCALAQFTEAEASLPPDATVADAMALLQESAGRVADIYDTFAAGLEKGPWAADVQPAIDRVTALAREQARIFRTLADARTTTAFRAGFDDLRTVIDEDQSVDALRAELGLGPRVHVDLATCTASA
ncbi:hypothetical protein [Aquihabitans sp. McL0605]|uniref:hypothetical protein n=1 Tax=Aquihabitans sp. McL0605 TaxID=3415671 RepID=UPI003CF58996